MTRLIMPVGRRDHVLGDTTNPITLVQYGSYDCTHCAQAERIVNDIKRRLNGRLRVVYRHFPRINQSSISQRAAEAAEAAGDQGQFWAMHRLLLQHAQDLSEGSISLCATLLDLDMARFFRNLHQGEYAQRVVEDFESGLRSGVSSTPTFFINGVRHDDYWDLETLLAATRPALTVAKADMGGSRELSLAG